MYSIGDTVRVPKKVMDIKRVVNLFDDKQETIFNVDGIWYTEQQLLDWLLNKNHNL